MSDKDNGAPGTLGNIGKAAEHGAHFVCPVHVGLFAHVRLYGVKDNQPRPVLRNCFLYALVGQGILSMFGDRIGKLLLKQAVEQNVCNHILASDTDIDAQTYQQMRGKSYQEVLRTNGQISFPEVLRQQRRW